jgi:hypothetical protein
VTSLPSKRIFDPKALVTSMVDSDGCRRFVSPWGSFLSASADERAAWGDFDRWVHRAVANNAAAKAVLIELVDEFGVDVPIAEFDDPGLAAEWEKVPRIDTFDDLLLAESPGTVLVGQRWSGTLTAAFIRALQLGVDLVAILVLEDDFLEIAGIARPLPVLVAVEQGQAVSAIHALSTATPTT